METPESSSPEQAEREAFKEKLRSLSFGSVPGANRDPKGKRAKQNPAWERGLKGEHRRDGSFMPYLGKDNEPIRVKEWAENRHTYEANLNQIRSGHPLKD